MFRSLPTTIFYGAFGEGAPEYQNGEIGFFGSVLFNDTDLDMDTVSIISHTNPLYGQLTLLSDGTFRYSPGNQFPGQDEFTYTITDGVNTSTATVRLWDSADPSVAGQTAIMAGQAPGTGPAAQPAPAPGAGAWTIVKKRFDAAANDMLLESIRRLANGTLNDTPFLNNDSSRLWIGADNNLHGSVLLSADGNRKRPFGIIDYDGNGFNGDLYLPQVDASGEVVDTKKINITKSGITGIVPYSENTFAEFKDGKFERLQFEDTRKVGLTVAVDKNGNVTFHKDGRVVNFSVPEGGLTLSDNTNSVFISANKQVVSFNIEGVLQLDLKQQPGAPLDAGFTLKMGDFGTISVRKTGVAPTVASASFELKNLKFGFGYSEQPGGANPKLNFHGEFSWGPNETPPWLPTPPPQGFAAISLTPNIMGRKVTFDFGISLGIRW